MGLAVDEEGALRRDFVAGGEAGADDVVVLAVGGFEAGAEGERGECEGEAAVVFFSGYAPGDVADAGGENSGFGDEGDGRGLFGGEEVGVEGGGEAGVDEAADEEAVVGIGEMEVDLAGADLGVEFGGNPSDGGDDVGERAAVVGGELHGLADAGSVLELRSGFGLGIHTALARIEGRAVGVLANNPHHLGGAIDADAADKAARFMQLCNAHSLPLVSLVDTPGFMVGPDTEATAQVRHVSRMFIAAAHLRVPYLSVVLRKGYGLGAMAMTAGGFHAPLCTVAWPSAEFGAMGLEGAVRLGFKKELEAVPEGAERDALFAQLLAQHVDKGSALAMASSLEIDAVIDPADTRAWLVRGLTAGRVGALRGAAIDTW